jgi:tRNA (guanine-N7-)-methyltransferase
MDWSVHYPAFGKGDVGNVGEEDVPSTTETAMEGGPKTWRRAVAKQVEVADIGCGFGGLLFALAPKMPDTLIMGML